MPNYFARTGMSLPWPNTFPQATHLSCLRVLNHECSFNIQHHPTHTEAEREIRQMSSAGRLVKAASLAIHASQGAPGDMGSARLILWHEHPKHHTRQVTTANQEADNLEDGLGDFCRADICDDRLDACHVGVLDLDAVHQLHVE